MTTKREVFSGPLGEQLHRRLEQATAEAQTTLGDGLDPGQADDLVRLRGLIAALTERLARGADAPSARDHEAALERLHQRFEGRSQALARAQTAIADLRKVTSPDAMLARAPATLCQHSTLRRALLSVVREGKMIAHSAHFADDLDGARQVLEQLQANPVALEHPLLETELLRRRRATIVVDAHVHPRVDRRTAELMRWRSYAAAPLLVGAKVIGVIHADRGVDQPLDVLDRDVLWEFASGLTHAYESASLRRTLRQERDQMRQFLEWLNARSGVLTDAPVTLAAPPRATLPGTGPARDDAESPEGRSPLDGSEPLEGRDDRVVFAGLVTPRELDVLRLLAEGSTNKAIADALVVSDATVKFHVNSILRKLHVHNRAEAVSRYLALLGMPPP